MFPPHGALPSCRSVLSFGEDKSEWSDDDSVLSSARDQHKPSLVQLQQQMRQGSKVREVESDSDCWDEDSLPINSARLEALIVLYICIYIYVYITVEGLLAISHTFC